MCSAPGHEQTVLSCTELEACNLGYAKSCSRLPKDRLSDAVRFAVVNDSSSRISVKFVFEMDYLPGDHGLLEYDRLSKIWAWAHPEPRVQKLAECFLQAYLDRQSPIPTASA
jgi:hypothetical protein